MASDAHAATNGVSAGRVFSHAFGVLRSNPGVMFGVAFLLQAVPSLIIGMLRLSLTGRMLTRDDTVLVVLISIVFAFLNLLFAMIVQGALVRATVAHSEGRRASFGESFSAGANVGLPLIGVIILMSIGFAIGFLLFIVPGFILFAMWAVVVPVLVQERTGVFEAFGRSRALTKGARWKVIGIELLMLVAIYAVVIVVGLLAMGPARLSGLGAGPSAFSPVPMLFNALAEVFGVPGRRSSRSRQATSSSR